MRFVSAIKLAIDRVVRQADGLPMVLPNKVLGVPLFGAAAGGPAVKAGIRAGDVLMCLAGQRIDTIYGFVKALNGLKIGKRVTIAVMRDGQGLSFRLPPRAE